MSFGPSTCHRVSGGPAYLSVSEEFASGSWRRRQFASSRWMACTEGIAQRAPAKQGANSCRRRWQRAGLGRR